ncbi:hypothetical protein PHJA_002597000 [Phtheirospermum japonicum]|uniref:Uncharacterized protein n=1 Tax=Phtheirospermum japonicum TaxID=374723 RepID=A0A830CX96_9LAMI|nr:hypothetical protein PHJA_002597000 [Phtheirospermum japonicum]
MEEQCSPLSWAYYYQEEGVDELKQSLLFSTLELEAAVISAHEEISRKDDEILQLKGLLSKIIKERDEFQAKSQELVLEKQSGFQQIQILAHSSKQHLDTCPISSGTTSNEDASDCDDNNIVVATSPGWPVPAGGDGGGPTPPNSSPCGPAPTVAASASSTQLIDIPPVTITSPTTTKILNQESFIISPSANIRAMGNRMGQSFHQVPSIKKFWSLPKSFAVLKGDESED